MKVSPYNFLKSINSKNHPLQNLLVAAVIFLCGGILPYYLIVEFTHSGYLVGIIFTPLLVWVVGNYLGGREVELFHLVWTFYGFLVLIFLSFGPIGWLPGTYETWEPLFWLPWGVVGTVLITWLSARIYHNFFEKNVWEKFSQTGKFDFASLLGCFYTTGLVLLVFWLPLSIYRWMDLGYNYPLLLAWLLIVIIITVRSTYLLARKVFDIDLFTSSLLSLWPLSMAGYYLLAGMKQLMTFRGSKASFREISFLVNFWQNLKLTPLLLIFIAILLVLGILFYWRIKSSRSWFIRSFVNAIIAGGLSVFLLAAFTISFAKFFLIAPEYKLPNWEHISRPEAEENFMKLEKFGEENPLDLETVTAKDNFDTKSYLEDISDTLQKSRQLFKKDLHFPAKYLKDESIPGVMNLIELGRGLKLKCKYHLRKGEYNKVFEWSDALLSGAHNLFKSKSPLIAEVANIKQKALDVYQELLTAELNYQQRRQLHSRLLDASAWPESLSNSYFFMVVKGKNFPNREDFQQKMMENWYFTSGSKPFPELWYLKFKFLESSENIKEHLTSNYYHVGIQLDAPPHRVNWSTNFPSKEKSFLHYILKYPHFPLSSYIIASEEYIFKTWAEEAYKPVSRARKLLHKNNQKIESDKKLPVPASFKKDPLSGKSIEELMDKQ
ncbi:MAG: hypothetical protein ACQEP7_06325 [bacterium]